MALNADHYRGAAPLDYEESRRHKPEWPVEQALIEEMVADGPVLDVPLGTGRYLDIYQAKGLRCVGLDISPEMIAQAKLRQPDLDAVVGTVFDLPFPDASFGTVVCSRLLNWFYPADMARAVSELKRVGRTVVVSIRTGMEGEHGNYTHDLSTFYRAIGGHYIEDRRLIRRVDSGDFEMFKLRLPTSQDFHAYLKGRSARRLASRWTAHFGVTPVDWGKITAEYWTHERLAKLIADMATSGMVGGVKNEILTDEPPRHNSGSLRVVRSCGRDALIDGRRRANIWMKQPGTYPVLVAGC